MWQLIGLRDAMGKVWKAPGVRHVRGAVRTVRGFVTEGLRTIGG